MKYEFRWFHELFFAALIAASMYVLQTALTIDLSTITNGRELAISLAAGAGRVFFAVLLASLAKLRPGE